MGGLCRWSRFVTCRTYIGVLYAVVVSLLVYWLFCVMFMCCWFIAYHFIVLLCVCLLGGVGPVLVGGAPPQQAAAEDARVVHPDAAPLTLQEELVAVLV